MSGTIQDLLTKGYYDRKEHDEQSACVMAHYNLSDEEWNATPERLRTALLKEYDELDKSERWKQLRRLQQQAAKERRK